MYSSLYAKHNYRNKNIFFLFSKRIVEYDIKAAGYNLIKEYGLLPQSKIDELTAMPNKERQIRVGVWQKYDKKLTSDLTKAFVEIRKKFFEANLIQDDDILAIKKDAIFCLRPCDITHFNDIEFIEKNVYSSYIFMANCEFYYGRDGVDVKGINDENVELHKQFILSHITNCVKHFEVSTKETQLRFMKRFIDDYKSLKLPVGYYRQFDVNSRFTTQFDDGNTYNVYWEDKKDELDISYNYINILVYLMRIAL